MSGILPIGTERLKQGRWHVKTIDGWRRRSIVVIEKKLGIKIPRRGRGDAFLNVHHKDEDITNDKPGNLELMTVSKHAKLHRPKGSPGLPNIRRGERHGMAKLTQKKVNKIRKLFKLGYTQTSIARMFNTSQPGISTIVNNKRWN